MTHDYNQFYSYPGMELWDIQNWEKWKSSADPLLGALEECIDRENAKRSEEDAYADRHDEVYDQVNHCPYFTDVVENWRKKRMVFSSYGMMELTMAPVSVEMHEKHDPDVLYIPVKYDRDDPHAAMNILKKYEQILTLAAQEETLVQFIPLGKGVGGWLLEHGLETQGTFMIRQDRVYMDVSVFAKAGLELEDIEGLNLSEWRKPFEYCGTTVVDISDKWQAHMAHQPSITAIYQHAVPEWNWDRHIRSTAGRLQAEGMRLERDYSGPHDPRFQEWLKDKGIKYEDHDTADNWWVTLSPANIREKSVAGEKIPLLLVMKEPRTSVPSMMLTAFQFYYNFIEICARGEFMMLFFALETPQDNDEFLPGIIEEAAQIYPVDRSRIYITGQSHNGLYALEFYRKHPEILAGAATLSDPIGIQNAARVDYYDGPAEEIVKSFRQHDMPLININGQLENSYRNQDRKTEKIAEDVLNFQKRLEAFRCPERMAEEINAAKYSKDYVTRMNGIPADATQLRYIMGEECYVSDLKNTDGKWHLRFVTIGNCPHMIMPQMAELSWEFLRRFSRSTQTGEIVELY